MSEREPATSEHSLSFGAWIQQRRKALDLTQDALARRVGCSVSAIRKIESDERRPSRQVAELLAEQLGLPPDQREKFQRVARGQMRVDRLPTPVARSGPVKLPIPTTPFLGRGPELTALDGLLLDPQRRLLTITGPGGIGKTRLALKAASRHQHTFPDGVCFVPLASLGSPTFLASAIADALDLVFRGQAEPRLQLLSYLREKQALLLLDNTEHLLAGIELLAEMVEHAPKLKLLVTSRERLGLRGEWVLDIQGLPVPPAGSVERADEYSAVALFVQSARRAQAWFELKAPDRPAVVRICQMVEGMPLGIELAAAWVPVLTCSEIAHEIERNLDFLATTTRNVPERQRSLRAAFNHSWELLSPEERAGLSRLAIFRGGFGRDAAEQVAGATLQLLSALVAKSLVRRAASGRFDLHEVVRQYAEAHLADDSEGETAARDRHCEYYLGLLRDREKTLRSVAQRETIRELTDEIDNVRSAWAWAIDRGKFVQLGQALRSFGFLADVGGWLDEGFEQLALIVQALRRGPQDEARRKVLGQALAQQGLLSQFQGEHVRAENLFEQSLEILRPIGDPALLTDPLIFYGFALALCGEFDRARSLTDEGLACARAAGDQWYTARGLFDQGFAAGILGRYDEAYDRMNAGLAVWRRLGDPRSTALGLNFLSRIVIKLGRLDEARAHLAESLALSTEIGDRWGIGTAYRYLGLAALADGDISEARSLLSKALALYRQLGMRWDIVQSLIYLGEVAITGGDPAEAKGALLEAIPLALETRAVPLAADAMIGLAGVQAKMGETSEALTITYSVLRHAGGAWEVAERAGRLRAELEPQVSPPQMETARAQAEAGSFEEVAAAALARAKSETGRN